MPLATNTSLGQIVNARSLETQVSRLLAHPIAEVRELGCKLREAATGPAWNVNAQAGAAFAEKLAGIDSGLAAEAASLLNREVRTAPTLVKYAEANAYLIATRTELEQAAAEVLADVPIASAPVVDLVERTETLEVELAATLIYSGERLLLPPGARRGGRPVATHGSTRSSRLACVIAGGTTRRSVPFMPAQRYAFDILMDIGGFRDMHRHRRCVQIKQGFTAKHGFETPEWATRPVWSRPALSQITKRQSRPRITPSARVSGERARGGPSRPYICCPSPPVSAASSRWTSPKRNTSPSCDPPGGPFQLPPRRVGDVPGPPAAASSACPPHPRDGFHSAHRFAAAIAAAASRQSLLGIRTEG